MKKRKTILLSLLLSSVALLTAGALYAGGAPNIPGPGWCAPSAALNQDLSGDGTATDTATVDKCYSDVTGIMRGRVRLLVNNVSYIYTGQPQEMIGFYDLVLIGDQTGDGVTDLVACNKELKGHLYYFNTKTKSMEEYLKNDSVNQQVDSTCRALALP
ncbi:MAG TPA: hypothetical protein VJB65_01985 [Patescibacteria group bacterium]|nr:hypothetical protein [Patescibacteria group bacterium]